ncbi:hypothetical protein MLD38_022870 [Melastoma candidum]|uniref:Uncharacterized protein n=1 Tax=Melastoma candidum TaxID=119954 RepID=A0ACB9QLX0_9MYRT|nr:hypothetical protein MLD38_022870 [Melastoma candidum]
MQKSGFVPDGYAYGVLVHGLCINGSMKEASRPLSFLKEMVDKGMEPNLSGYGSTIGALCKDRKWEEAQESQVKESVVREGVECLSYRIEKLSTGISVGSAFQQWMGEGFPIHRGDIFHAVNRLRKLKKDRQALEMMEWVIRERPYRPNELEYSYLLEFTTRIHGISHGERLFSRVPSEFHTALLYNNFLIVCLEKGVIRLSLAYMKKMRELDFPISYLVFNRLILLHSSPKRRKIIPKILTQMKADGVPLHVSTYNILMKMEANEHNVERLLKVYGEMRQRDVEPNEVSYCILALAHVAARLYTAAEAYVEAIEMANTGRNWNTLDILLMLYGYLGKVKELERTWVRLKDLPHVRDKNYVVAIEAFGRMGDIDRAEGLWNEMKSVWGLDSAIQFNCLMFVYCKHGLIAKASALFREAVAGGIKPDAITYRHLALGCLKAGLHDEALKTMELGSRLPMSRKLTRSTPWLETTLSIMEMFAERGDVDNAEGLFDELSQVKYARYTFVGNALIRAYVRAKEYNPNLLRRMILGGARPDAETYSLLKLAEELQGTQFLSAAPGTRY